MNLRSQQAKVEAASGAAPVALPTWGTVSTMKEKPEVVLDFVAHHLLLGADEIIIYFDDPEDPAIALLQGQPKVRAIPCDAAFVAGRGRHPSGLPARQKIHARYGYEESRVDWIIHIDADEFIQSDRPIGQILAQAEGDVLRLSPFEALATPRAGNEGRAEHYYRGVLPNSPAGARLAKECYGPFEDCLARGMLSHQAGKFFVRRGVEGMALSVHGPFLNGTRAQAQDTAEARLLHFHGGVYATWRRHLDRRLSDDAGGTYSGRLAVNGGAANNFSLLETLQGLHRSEGEAGLERFFRAACTWGPEKRGLRRIGALVEANLWSEAKRVAVFGGTHHLAGARFDPESGIFEADRNWRGLTLRLAPDLSYPECLLARDLPWMAAALASLSTRLQGQTVAFADLAAGAGILALAVLQAAGAGSQAFGYTQDLGARARAQRNGALNAPLDLEMTPSPEAALGALQAARTAASPKLQLLHLEADQAETSGFLKALGEGFAPDMILISAGKRAALEGSTLWQDLTRKGWQSDPACPGMPALLIRSSHS